MRLLLVYLGFINLYDSTINLHDSNRIHNACGKFVSNRRYETKEELDELSRNGGTVMGEAIKAYHGITATEEFKNLEWLRAKTRHDEAQALNNARKKAADAERMKLQCVIDEKDAKLADKDAELAELRLLLETLRNST